MSILFQALPSPTVRVLQRGGKDAYALAPLQELSDGEGNPCRHCFTEIPKGRPMLVLAHRPFPALQPYAETGPIFLCGEPCQRHTDHETLPVMFRAWEKVLLRGYSQSHRICGGTGTVTPVSEIEAEAANIFAKPEVAYIHMRSASNNCYLCRIERKNPT